MQSQFATRLYEVFLLLSHPDAQPLWHRDAWMDAVPRLSPLMVTSRGRASARVLQLGPGPGSPNKRALKFGPIGWNEKSHYKWTHAQAGSATSSDADFRSLEFWVPSDGQCERDSCPPETFFSLAQEDGPKDGRRYGYMAALAIAQDRNELVNEAEAVVKYLSSVMRPVLLAKSRRTWGGQHDGPPSERQNSIGDTFFVAGLFKPGKRHVEPLTVDGLKGAWKSLE